MEFFEFADVLTTAEKIRDKVSIDTLPFFCAAIEAVDEAGEMGRVIYFLHWGRFHIQCTNVLGGVRFYVPDCPNALAWTVTTGYPPHPEKIVLHATINRLEHDEEFIAATKDLIACLKNGLEKNFNSEFSASKAESASFVLTDLRKK
ncbi:MAG: hypothetical protein KQH63_11245 [Desulfobulbaceae bacterium]|nr:hypothetical protein [Desulfobulbaceae bacterium]